MEGNDLFLLMPMWSTLRNYLFFSSSAKNNSRNGMFTSLFWFRSKPFCFVLWRFHYFLLMIEPAWICLNLFYRKKTKKFRQNLILQSSDASIIENHHSLKQGAIFTKYRKSNIFNFAYLFSYRSSFSNHNDKIFLLSS